MASYNNYYHDYPYTGTVRDRYPSNVSSSGHGTAVPPTAGPSPPPRAPPAARPHTTQPQPGYGYGPPPLPQGYPAPPRGGGVYGAHYAGYPQFGGYGAPPMSYADSLPVQPSMLGAGGGNAGNPKSPRIEEKDGRDPSKPDPDTLNSKSPVSSSPPLSNAAALAQAEAAVPGISERLPDFKDWPAEDRDRAIRELVERLAPQKYAPAGYGHPPPPQHYPGHPYYGFYPPPMPHAGYNPHMPPPHHEGYGYPPPPLLPLQPPQLPQQQNAERDDYSGEEAEERERIDRERERERAGAGAGNGGAQIMPGGYASSPSRETPSSPPPPQPQSNIHSRPATPQNTPPNPKSPPPVQPQNNNKIVDLQDAHNRDRPGSMPPPKTRPVKTPAPEDMGKNMSNSLHMLGRMGSRREQHGKVGAGAADSTLVEQLGPGGQGDMTTIGGMWGVYLLEHKGQKKGSLPELRSKLRGLLGGIAAWIIKDIEPKDSLVIPPDKLIKFYQLSQVADEPFKWEAFIHSLPLHNLGELYQQLECHHHLIPPPPRPSSAPATNANTNPTTPENPTQDSTYAPFDPTIPALTPQGFTHWMLVQLTAFPTREHRRLQKIITEFPIQDPETNARFPKSLPRDTLPASGDGLVENWWEEAVMSVRKGGYISMGFDEDGIGGDIDFGYGPNSELVRGRERRPYAKSNVSSRAASRSQSRGDQEGNIERERSRPRGAGDGHDFVPPALTRKKTDQKYASTNIPFDDLREDTTKTAEIERKRKPYVAQPNKAAREAVYSTGGGGGTPINPRPGGGGMGMGVGGERPGSHGSGSGGSGGRLGPNNGGGVDLPSTPSHTTNIPTAGLHSNANTTSSPPIGGIKIKTPTEYKPHPHHPYSHYSSRYPNSSTPTTPASAHPSNSTANNTPSTLFSSPQSQARIFTPISPLSGGGAYPELHHYPSPCPAPNRGYSRRERERERERDISPPTSMPTSQEIPPIPATRIHMRRRSMGAGDAAEYFGGALPVRGDYEPERGEYPSHGGRAPAAAQPHPYLSRRDWERRSAEHEDEEVEETYYRPGYPHGGVHGGHGYGHVRRREEREDQDEGGSMGFCMGGGGERPGVRRRKSKGPGEFREY